MIVSLNKDASKEDFLELIDSADKLVRKQLLISC